MLRKLTPTGKGLEKLLCFHIQVRTLLMEVFMFHLPMRIFFRHLDEKQKELEEALEHIQILEREMANKQAEVKYNVPQISLDI